VDCFSRPFSRPACLLTSPSCRFLVAASPFGKASWEKLNIFLSLLVLKLSAPEETGLAAGLLDAVNMDSYRVEARTALSIVLADADGAVGPTPIGAGRTAPAQEIDGPSNMAWTFDELCGVIALKGGAKICQIMAEELPAKVSAHTTYRSALKNFGRENVRLTHDSMPSSIFSPTTSSFSSIFRTTTGLVSGWAPLSSARPTGRGRPAWGRTRQAAIRCGGGQRPDVALPAVSRG